MSNFGKEYKKQMVPEWAEAYMDYKGLQRILRQIFHHKKRTRQPTNTHVSNSMSSEGDIEDQVLDITTPNLDSPTGSTKLYKTQFLKKDEQGGDIEAVFFHKLDEELNKVNAFYKNKVEEMTTEASLLDTQMDALIAFRIKLNKPSLGNYKFIILV